MMRVRERFCAVDDVCQPFAPVWHTYCRSHGTKRRNRSHTLALSEMRTILLLFHTAHSRHFKAFYTEHVCVQLSTEFPPLVSYTRFVELFPLALVPRLCYLDTCLGPCTGGSCVDSTKLAVGHNRRISQHRGFRGWAKRGKTSAGWFFGFKLHLVCNDRGALRTFRLTPGNVDDRTPVPQLAQPVFGTLCGDKGYRSQALVTWVAHTCGVEFITPPRKNMQPHDLSPIDNARLRQRVMVESIIDQLKNISQIEHTRHRSPVHFLVNLVGGLIAYCHRPQKPSLQ